MMQPKQLEPHSKLRRAVADIVIVEMMLVQATIESGSLVGECISELGAQTYGRGNGVPIAEPIRNILLRTRDDVVESYASRFSYLQKLRNS